MNRLMGAATPIPEVKSLPRFPAVSRDIALVMDETTPIGSVVETIRRAAGKTLEDVKLFDPSEARRWDPARRAPRSRSPSEPPTAR
jgi:hypothetical protein